MPPMLSFVSIITTRTVSSAEPKVDLMSQPPVTLSAPTLPLRDRLTVLAILA